MPLTRKEIRQGVVSRLQASTVSPLDTATVYDWRSTPVQQDEGPLTVTVLTPKQTDEKASSGQPQFRQVTTIVIESHVRADIDPADPADGAVLGALADDLDEAVNQTLFTDPTWIDEFDDFPRVEHITDTSVTRGAAVGLVRTFIDVENHRGYQPDPAYYTSLDGVDTEVRPIDPDTEAPHTSAHVDQEIDLP
jgi:hypothetical protein